MHVCFLLDVSSSISCFPSYSISFRLMVITQFRLRCLLSLTCVLVCKAFGWSPIDTHCSSVPLHLRNTIISHWLVSCSRLGDTILLLYICLFGVLVPLAGVS